MKRSKQPRRRRVLYSVLPTNSLEDPEKLTAQPPSTQHARLMAIYSNVRKNQPPRPPDTDPSVDYWYFDFILAEINGVTGVTLGQRETIIPERVPFTKPDVVVILGTDRIEPLGRLVVKNRWFPIYDLRTEVWKGLDDAGHNIKTSFCFNTR